MVMQRGVALFVIGALALSACQKREDKAPAPVATAAPVAVASAAPAAKAGCAPMPALALARDFADPQGQFAKDGEAFKRLETNFAEAYRKACDDGLLKDALVPGTSPHPGTLFLHNAPDANEVAIYLEPNEGDRRSDMLLEYYFITADGQAHVPNAADLHEGIYCSTAGATEQEEDESGRCLVD
jgi:hypothetical protein